MALREFAVATVEERGMEEMGMEEEIDKGIVEEEERGIVDAEMDEELIGSLFLDKSMMLAGKSE